MARAVNRLSARKVVTLATPGLHADGDNLYLNVRPSGARSWVLIASVNGRRVELGLGPLSLVSLAQAREKAREGRLLISEGRDPRQIWRRNAAGAAELSFGAFALDYVERHEAGWKNPKHRQQWRNTLKTYAASIWETRLDDVGVEDILAVLTPIWTTKPETASRVRGRIERILDAARVRGLRTGENPALWRGNLALLLPRHRKSGVRHHPALPFRELPDFMTRLREQPGLAARALEFTILTATRTSETLHARWSEFDLANRVWTLPAERMKAGRAHRIPLADRVLALLDALGRNDEYVFPGLKPGRPLSNMAMEMVLRRMTMSHVTVHGFRSTFRDWVAEVTDFPRDVAEHALAHLVGNAVERAYRRGDAFERRGELMREWEGYILGD